MKYHNILQLIGNTPHIQINKIFPDDFNIWLKLEKQNPGGSIKDRIALSMIEDAEKKGILKPNSIIVEPTSGNTGIGLAMIAAVKGYKCILIMPESMSPERVKIMEAYGAEIILTDKETGMNGSITKAEEIIEENPNAWMPMQFENPANVEAHRNYTANEIIKDFPEGVDYLIAGVGTGGHITGCAEMLKKKFPLMKVFAVEPENSQVIAGKEKGKHKIQGIGAGFIPEILNTDIIDETISVTNKDAYKFSKLAAKEEGIFVGLSSGATLAATEKKLNTFNKNST